MKRLEKEAAQEPVAGLAGWLLVLLRQGIARLRRQAGRSGAQRAQPQLALIERIPLAPRQSLALVEAEGRRLLVATSAESGPVFYALDATILDRGTLDRGIPNRVPRIASRRTGRVSW